MTEIIKTAAELGKKDKQGSIRYILRECRVCKNKKWIKLSHAKESWFTGLCVKCRPTIEFSGANNHLWKNGRFPDSHGYILIMAKNHPLADKKGYVYEHRLVAAEKYGIAAVVDNDVHHIDGNITNNNIENLELISRSKHSSLHNRPDNCTSKLPDELNYKILCACGCEEGRLKYDKRGRLRRFINHHHKR